MKDKKITVYPTLLDTFQGWVDSEKIWNNYFGRSDDPKKTIQEFSDEKEKEVIDKVNGVFRSTPEIKKGQAFNKLMDTVIDSHHLLEELFSYQVDYEGEQFIFENTLVRDLYNILKNSVSGIHLEQIYQVNDYWVRLHGFVDYILLDHVVDLKTTKSYKFGKYSEGCQHKVYLTLARDTGFNISDFSYIVTDFKSIYEEHYKWAEEWRHEIMQSIERFIFWVEQNIEKLDPGSRIFRTF